MKTKSNNQTIPTKAAVACGGRDVWVIPDKRQSNSTNEGHCHRKKLITIYNIKTIKLHVTERKKNQNQTV